MNKFLLGISKIILAVLILMFAFATEGVQKPLAIWLGFVVAFPITLWGIIDFLKKKDSDREQENNNDQN